MTLLPHSIICFLNILFRLTFKIILSHEAQLAFSRKARAVEWQPKTMQEYRRLQPKEYVELGKLPADLNSPQLIKKVNHYTIIKNTM